MKGCICFLFPVLFFSNTSSADVYQWLDEEGKTHFSDQNPDTGVPEDNIREIEIPAVNIIEKNDREEQYTKDFLKEKDKERMQENAKLARLTSARMLAEKKQRAAQEKKQKSSDQKQARLPKAKVIKSKPPKPILMKKKAS